MQIGMKNTAQKNLPGKTWQVVLYQSVED